MHKVPAIVEKVLEIALEASREVMAVYQDPDFAVVDKGDDQGPLTQADLRANRVICDGIAGLGLGVPILTEEAAWQGGAAKRYWAVDPLDGTKEFVARNGEFTVNIALIEHGRPTLGVVVAPAIGEAWLGLTPDCSLWEAGAGRSLALKKIGLNSSWQVICAQTTLNAKEAITIVASRSHPSQLLTRWITRCLAQVTSPVSFVEKGSSLKLCLVAEGAAHAYPRLGPTCIWDTAAGHAVVKAAGAQVLAVDGESLRLSGELLYPDPTQTLNPFFVVISPAFLAHLNSLESA